MNFKDLERLQRRIERLQAQKRPPRLKCVVVQDGEESPAPEILNDPATKNIKDITLSYTLFEVDKFKK